MKTDNRKQVLISDLHTWSTVGIWPEGFISKAGSHVGQNKYQGLLWEIWNHMWDWAFEIIGGDPYDLIINGDIVEGDHHRSKQVMTGDRDDQMIAAEMIIRPRLCYDPSLFIVQGTECHTHDDELWIGQELGAHKDPSTGHHAFRRLELELPTGKLLAVSHHMPTTKRIWTEANALNAELQNEVAEKVRNGVRPPDMIARAHRHIHGYYSNGRQAACCTGAWQGLTRFGDKVVPHAIPAPSMIILDSSHKEEGELPTIHEKVVSAPH